MTMNEKAELLKPAITQLYSKEGRSFSYISRLLDIDRKALTSKIREWKIPEAEPRRHLTPSMQKFVNKNRQYIKSRLDKDISLTKIAESLKISRHQLYRTLILNDEVLTAAHAAYISRLHTKARETKQQKMDQSRLSYDPEDLPGEQWKDVLGYEGYQVSNMGRVKHYTIRYKAYHLVKSFPNKNNGRLYVAVYNASGPKNLALARLVAHAFIEGYSDTNNTVNHKDGDVTNNRADNLEWISQGENNAHSYRELKRPRKQCKRYDFRVIQYQNKYEFKTVAAFARFLGKSETQTRRYLDSPAKYKIKLVK